MSVKEHLQKAWNESLADFDKALDHSDQTAEDAKNTVSAHREKLKASYHDAVADGTDDDIKKIEERLKATKAKAKAKGYELS